MQAKYMKQWFSRQWMLENKGQWWLRDEKQMLWVLRSPQRNVWREALGHGCFPSGSLAKNSPAITGVLGLIPGSGRSPGGRHGNPLQYSCLGNAMDRGARWDTVHGVARSQMWLSTLAHTERTQAKSCKRQGMGSGTWSSDRLWELHSPWIFKC